MTRNNTALLRAFTLNAGFSATSALLMLATAPWLAAQLGLAGPAQVYVVAVVLALFALQLVQLVRAGQAKTWEITLIIGSDISWVIGSAILVAICYEQLTLTGLVLVDLAAVIVMVLAVMQIRALRASPGETAA